MKQVLVVFKHEWLYFKTLDRIKMSILIQTFAAAIIFSLHAYINKRLDYRLAAIIMIIGIPRIPMALIGYSIAGEKVYKTLESIVSSAIEIKQLLLGKLIIPLVTSLVMFTLALLFTVGSALVYSKLGFKAGIVFSFTWIEWLVIILGGVGVVLWIIFITAVLTLVVKVPRNGLFITSLMTFLMGIPHSYIFYVKPENLLQLSTVFMLLMLGLDIVCYSLVLGRLRTQTFFARA